MVEPPIEWQEGAALPADRPRTLPELLASTPAVRADRPVLHHGDAAWSWPRLLERAAALRRTWPEVFQPGQRVIITSDNDPRHLVVELACWLSSAVAVPLNGRIAPAGLRLLAEEIEPAAWFTGTASVPAGSAIALAEIDRLPAATPLPPVSATPRTPALILFTSGSSGVSRGVVLSHDNLCSQQAAFARLWPMVGPDDRLVSYLPWYHSFGSLAERWWALLRGAAMRLVPGDGHDHDALLAALRRERPTVFMSVPALHDIVASAGVLDPRPLRWVFNAGAALGHRAEERYAAAGIRILEGWGMTETSPSATITPLADPRIPGVVGRPIPGVGVGIDAGGRILVRGPGVMQGYWRRPAETARILVDGVLDSGDLGEWTGHGLRLRGRDDHMLKHPNGEKIPAGAIEDRLELLPGVAAAVLTTVDEGLAAVLVGDLDRDRLRDQLLGFNAAQPHRYLRLRTVWLLPAAAAAGGRTGSFKKARGAYLAALAAGLASGGTGVATLRLVD